MQFLVISWQYIPSSWWPFVNTSCARRPLFVEELLQHAEVAVGLYTLRRAACYKSAMLSEYDDVVRHTESHSEHWPDGNCLESGDVVSV